MIKTTVIDNWLEPDLADYVSTYLLNDINYFVSKSSFDALDTSVILEGIIPNNPLIQYLFYKINKIKNVNILRYYSNLQYANMNGDFHSDKGDITFLYMSSKNLNTDEGHFEIKDEEKIQYKFNRLIYFHAPKLHKGHGPIQMIPRITLAFKTKII
jgi:hypothetical protein